MAEPRNLICPETEDSCWDGGCKANFCKLERDRLQHEQMQADKDKETLDSEAMKLAPAYFKKKGIRNPTAAQIETFIRNPKVRALARERLATMKSLPDLKL